MPLFLCTLLPRFGIETSLIFIIFADEMRREGLFLPIFHLDSGNTVMNAAFYAQRAVAGCDLTEKFVKFLKFFFLGDLLVYFDFYIGFSLFFRDVD